jgi:hypothetical protein
MQESFKVRHGIAIDVTLQRTDCFDDDASLLGPFLTVLFMCS